MSATEDDKAFMLQLEELCPQIEAWLRKYGVPAQDAPDVARLVIERARRYAHTYDKSKPLAPWVRAIAKNMAADHLTTTILRSALALKDLHEVADSTPYHDLSRSEIFNRLTSVLSELDTETQALLHA